MNRKEFLKTFVQAGLFCCGAASALLGQTVDGSQKQTSLPEQSPDWIHDLEKRMIKGSETLDWRKYEKSVEWIKDLMDIMDAQLDPETKNKLMQANGRSCYLRAFGVASDEPPSAEAVNQFIDYMKKGGNDIKQEGNKTTIIYNWGRNHQNPWGLIIQDGYCMCPIVESGPPNLSPTYCQCSAGYVGEIFLRYTGKQAQVTVIESLKMGGKDCVFKVEILDS